MTTEFVRFRTVTDLSVWINPAHVVSVTASSPKTSEISLVDGRFYNVTENLVSTIDALRCV